LLFKGIGRRRGIPLVELASHAALAMPADQKDQRVCDIIAAAEPGKWFSLEFFPPKTEEGIANLRRRIQRMRALGPLFVDFTWGAGGSTSDLSMTLTDDAKNLYGCVSNMHLTCTNMETAKVDKALEDCKKCGVCNLVALRGDPPRGAEKWEAVDGGFTCALDLVKYIREKHGDYFSVAVAGYPEGHPDNITEVEGGLECLTDSEKRRARVVRDGSGKEVVTVCRDDKWAVEMRYLKEKCDAGAKVVITQMFLDAQVYVDFLAECKKWEINAAIVPGIMCLNNFNGFKRMTEMCKTRLPAGMLEAAAAANTSDDDFKAYGITYATEMCRQLIEGGAPGLHFYTLNLEKIVIGALLGLGLVTAAQAAACSAGEADAKSMVSAQGITTVESPVAAA